MSANAKFNEKGSRKAAFLFLESFKFLLFLVTWKTFLVIFQLFLRRAFPCPIQKKVRLGDILIKQQLISDEQLATSGIIKRDTAMSYCHDAKVFQGLVQKPRTS